MTTHHAPDFFPVPSPPELAATAPLEDKAQAALLWLDHIAEHYDPDRVAVAFTGGKDSTVTLDLWRRTLAKHSTGPLRALSLDTGLKFPEVIRLRDQLAQDWGVQLMVVRPSAQELDGLVPAVDVIECCRRLKVLPLQRALAQGGVDVLLTGLRRDEHPDRAGSPWSEVRQDPPHVRAHPLLAFSEMDVWAYILTRGLPSCELYSRGYRSLGCRPCTRPSTGAGERDGRAPEKEARMNILRELGYF